MRTHIHMRQRTTAHALLQLIYRVREEVPAPLDEVVGRLSGKQCVPSVLTRLIAERCRFERARIRAKMHYVE